MPLPLFPVQTRKAIYAHTYGHAGIAVSPLMTAVDMSRSSIRLLSTKLKLFAVYKVESTSTYIWLLFHCRWIVYLTACSLFCDPGLEFMSFGGEFWAMTVNVRKGIP